MQVELRRLVGEPSYAADFYDDRIPMAGGGALWKFIQGLFIKASNDIRQGKGKWKGLDQKQRIVQHDNLTKKVTEFQKSGNTEGLEVYFDVNPNEAFAAASKKVKKDRVATADEIEDYIEILDPTGEAGIVEEGMTIRQLDKMVAEDKAYMDDMYRQYKRGDLDKYVKPEVLEEQALRRQKKIDNVLAKAYDEVFYQKPVTGDYKLDADVLSDSIAEQLGKGAFTDLPQTHQTQIYNTALKRVTQDMKMKQTLKNVEEKMILSDFDVKGRKGKRMKADLLSMTLYLQMDLAGLKDSCYEEADAEAAQSANEFTLGYAQDKPIGGIIRAGFPKLSVKP